MRESVREYLLALEAGDGAGIVSLFEADGWVHSPFLGHKTASEFFPKVAESSSGTKICKSKNPHLGRCETRPDIWLAKFCEQDQGNISVRQQTGGIAAA